MNTMRYGNTSPLHNRLVIGALMSAIVLTLLACAVPATPTPMPIPMPTAAPTPSSTPMPTATPYPTPTPLPPVIKVVTATPPPSPTLPMFGRDGGGNYPSQLEIQEGVDQCTGTFEHFDVHSTDSMATERLDTRGRSIWVHSSRVGKCASQLGVARRSH